MGYFFLAKVTKYIDHIPVNGIDEGNVIQMDALDEKNYFPDCINPSQSQSDEDILIEKLLRQTNGIVCESSRRPTNPIKLFFRNI